MKRILIAYATKHGATAEIAVKVGAVLRQAGYELEIMPIEIVDDLDAFDVVIVGSAIYYGQWRKDAVNFLRDHQNDLREKAVWLFSSGPTGEGDPVDLSQGVRYPEQLQDLIDSINPQSIALFHGELNLNQINRLERFIINRIKAPTGDFRNWEMVEEWAQSIVKSLRQRALLEI
ncbi:MAG: flavodoxin domain-containing protein [Anaerolineae bacterium]